MILSKLSQKKHSRGGGGGGIEKKIIELHVNWPQHTHREIFNIRMNSGQECDVMTSLKIPRIFNLIRFFNSKRTGCLAGMTARRSNNTQSTCALCHTQASAALIQCLPKDVEKVAILDSMRTRRGREGERERNEGEKVFWNEGIKEF